MRGWRIASVSDSVYSNTNLRRSACSPGTRSIAALIAPVVAAVACRGRNQLPVRWKTVRRADHGRDLGHELDGARARADDRHALARQRVVVIPFGRVEAVPGEALGALDLRDARAGASCPVARISTSASWRRAARRSARSSGSARSSHAQEVTVVLGLHQAVDAVRACDVAQVGVDLRLRRAQPRPVAPLREGERVQVTGHVARGARVAVVEPRAAEVGSLLEDRDLARCRAGAARSRRRCRRSPRRRSAPRACALAGCCGPTVCGGHATPPPSAARCSESTLCRFRASLRAYAPAAVRASSVCLRAANVARARCRRAERRVDVVSGLRLVVVDLRRRRRAAAHVALAREARRRSPGRAGRAR